MKQREVNTTMNGSTLVFVTQVRVWLIVTGGETSSQKQMVFHFRGHYSPF